MIGRKVAVGVLVAAEFMSACSTQASSTEEQIISPPATIVESTTTPTSPSQIQPSETSTTVEVEITAPTETRLEEARDIAAEYMGKLACSVSEVAIAEDDNLGDNELGDEIVSQVDKNSFPPVMKLSEWLVEDASDQAFSRYVTHEMVHVCGSALKELEQPLTLPSGDVVTGIEAFTMYYDQNGPPEKIEEFGPPEEGAAEWITYQLTGGIASDTESYKAVYELTDRIVNKAGLSIEEVAQMVSEGDLMSFIAAYYEVNPEDITPTEFYDFMIEYADAWFSENS